MSVQKRYRTDYSSDRYLASRSNIDVSNSYVKSHSDTREVGLRPIRPVYRQNHSDMLNDIYNGISVTTNGTFTTGTNEILGRQYTQFSDFDTVTLASTSFGTFSLSFWFYYGYTIDSSPLKRGVILDYNSTLTVETYNTYCRDTNNFNRTIGSYSLPFFEWFHYVITFDKSNNGFKIYVDNNLVSNYDNAYVFNPTVRLGSTSGSYRCRGRFSDVCLFDYVLNPDQVAWLNSTNNNPYEL